MIPEFDSEKWVLMARDVTVYQHNTGWFMRCIQSLINKTSFKRCATEDTQATQEKLLEDVSFEISTGRVTAVMGVPTSGTKELLKLIGCRIPPTTTRGKVIVIPPATEPVNCNVSCQPRLFNDGSCREFVSLDSVFRSILSSIDYTNDNRVVPNVLCTDNASQHVTEGNASQCCIEDGTLRKSEGIGTTNSPSFETSNATTLQGYVLTRPVVGYATVRDWSLLAHLTIEETFDYAIRLNHPHLSSKLRIFLVNSMIETLDLTEQRFKCIGNVGQRVISTGERSRVVIGLQFLSYHKRFIVLEDPCSALDTFHADIMLTLFRKYAQQENRGVVISMNSARVTSLRHVDDIVLMHHNRVIYSGPLSQLEGYAMSHWDIPAMSRPGNIVCDILDVLRSPTDDTRFHALRQRMLDGVGVRDNALPHRADDSNCAEEQAHDCYYHSTTLGKPVVVSSANEYSLSKETLPFIGVFKNLVHLFFIWDWVWRMTFGRFLGYRRFSTDRPTDEVEVSTSKHVCWKHTPQRSSVLWTLIRRFSLNSRRNPWKMVPLVSSLLQGLFLGSIFAGLRQTSPSIFPASSVSHSLPIERSTLSVLWNDLKDLHDNPQLLYYLESEPLNGSENDYVVYLFANATFRKQIYGFLNCSYHRSYLDGIYGPLSSVYNSTDQDLNDAVRGMSQASRLIHNIYTTKIITDFRRALKGSLLSMINVPFIFQKFVSTCRYCVTNFDTPDSFTQDLASLETYTALDHLWDNRTVCNNSEGIPWHQDNMSLNQLYSILDEKHLYFIPYNDTVYMEEQRMVDSLMQSIAGYSAVKTSFVLLFPKLGANYFDKLQDMFFRLITGIGKNLVEVHSVGQRRHISLYMKTVEILFRIVQLLHTYVFNTVLKRIFLSGISSTTVSGCMFCLFSCMSYQSLMALFGYYEENSLLHTEVSNDVYSSMNFFLSQQISDLPLQILSTTLFTATASVMGGFFIDPVSKQLIPAFWTHLLLCNLISFVFFGFCYFISIIPHRSVAIIIASYIFGLWICYSGFVVNENRHSFLLGRLITKTSPYRYSYFVLIQNLMASTEMYGDMPNRVLHWLNGVPPSSTLTQNVLSLLVLAVSFRIAPLIYFVIKY